MIDKACWYRIQRLRGWSDWQRGTVRMLVWGSYLYIGEETPGYVAMVEDAATKLLVEVPAHHGICFQEEVPDARINTDDDRTREEK